MITGDLLRIDCTGAGTKGAIGALDGGMFVSGIRLTHTFVGNIRSWPHPSARVNQVYVENIRSRPQTGLRVTQVWVEVLRARTAASTDLTFRQP